MVRVIGLAVAFLSCWLCAPAQAGVLPVELPSTGAGTAAAPVTSSVTPVAERITNGAPAPVQQAVQTATAPARPAVEAVTTSPARVAQGGSGGSGGLRVGASSLRRAPSARLRTPPREATPPPRPATRPPRQRHQPPAPTQVRSKPDGAPTTSHRSTVRHESGGRPQPPLASGPDGGISAGTAFAGGLAVLAAALALVAPRLRRRLSLDLRALRQIAFVALPERPG